MPLPMNPMALCDFGDTVCLQRKGRYRTEKRAPQAGSEEILAWL